MITAQQAKKKSMQAAVDLERIRHINSWIMNSIARGRFQVLIPDLTPSEVRYLELHDYKVETTNAANQFLVKW